MDKGTGTFNRASVEWTGLIGNIKRARPISHSHETFGAWREGQHDDLVLAAALAGWWAERGSSRPWEVEPNPRRSVLCDVPRGVFRVDSYLTWHRDG